MRYITKVTTDTPHMVELSDKEFVRVSECHDLTPIVTYTNTEEGPTHIVLLTEEQLTMVWSLPQKPIE